MNIGKEKIMNKKRIIIISSISISIVIKRGISGVSL